MVKKSSKKTAKQEIVECSPPQQQDVSLENECMQSISDQPGNISISIEDEEDYSAKEKDLEQRIYFEKIESEETSKKRGRKPKGGKLYTKMNNPSVSKNEMANIILHLKCSLHDIKEHDHEIQHSHIVKDPLLYDPEIPPTIMSYDSASKVQFSEYVSNGNEHVATDVDKSEMEISNPNVSSKKTAYIDINPGQISIVTTKQQYCSSCNIKLDSTNNVEEDDPSIQMKDINYKLKKLKINLYKNANPDKKSACFWCTYDYDNLPCYIPKYEMNGELYGYGSFCRPECAVAYLMKENIDDSTKFERYHLLNQVYSKIYDFKKNIKPAPCPYYLLDKYYGNLSIQEYRKLLKTEHMLLIIEKPMTRILPELHEDNEDFIMNIYGGTAPQTTSKTGMYKVKRSTDKQKGPSKTTIIKENFGIST